MDNDSFVFLENHYGVSQSTIMKAVTCAYEELKHQGIETSVDEIADVVAENWEIAMGMGDFYIIDLWFNRWTEGDPPIFAEDEYGEAVIRDQSGKAEIYKDPMSGRTTLTLKLEGEPLIIRFDEYSLWINSEWGDVVFESDDNVTMASLLPDAQEAVKKAGLYEFWNDREAESIINELEAAMAKIKEYASGVPKKETPIKVRKSTPAKVRKSSSGSKSKLDNLYIMDLWINRWTDGNPIVEDYPGNILIRDQYRRAEIYEGKESKAIELVLMLGNEPLTIKVQRQHIENTPDYNHFLWINTNESKNVFQNSEPVDMTDLPYDTQLLLKKAGLYEFWDHRQAQDIVNDLQTAMAKMIQKYAS